MDNKKIEISDPVSNEIFLSSIYEKPFWIVEFENDTETSNPALKSNKIIAYIANNKIKYETRSVAKKNQILDKIDENKELTSKINLNSDRTVQENNELRSKFSDFTSTLSDRKINEINSLDETELLPDNINSNKIDEIKNNAMLCQNSDLKQLSEVNFDKTLLDCEVCHVSKFNKLPLSSTKERKNRC